MARGWRACRGSPRAASLSRNPRPARPNEALGLALVGHVTEVAHAAVYARRLAVVEERGSRARGLGRDARVEQCLRRGPPWYARAAWLSASTRAPNVCSRPSAAASAADGASCTRAAVAVTALVSAAHSALVASPRLRRGLPPRGALRARPRSRCRARGVEHARSEHGLFLDLAVHVALRATERAPAASVTLDPAAFARVVRLGRARRERLGRGVQILVRARPRGLLGGERGGDVLEARLTNNC